MVKALQLACEKSPTTKFTEIKGVPSDISKAFLKRTFPGSNPACPANDFSGLKHVVTILRVARVPKLAHAITGIPNGTTCLLTPPLAYRAIKRAHEAVNQVRAQVTKKGLS